MVMERFFCPEYEKAPQKGALIHASPHGLSTCGKPHCYYYYH